MRYFIITYFRKPNGQIDEQAEVSTKIRTRDIQTANIIMDFKENKIEKCLIDGKTINQSWEQTYEYYKKVYPAIFERLEKEAKKGQ
jgi:hypothetical protein